MVPIDYFDSAAEEYPERLAIVDGRVSLTFSELRRLSHQLACQLAMARSSDVPFPVAIYSPNDYRVMVAAIAIMRAGGVIVPVHAGNPIEVTRFVFKTVNPSFVFFHSSVTQQVELLRSECSSTVNWICLDAPKATVSSLAALANGDAWHPSEWINADGNRDRPVYYWSTSGTTGEPKVVIDDVISFEGALKLVRELNADDPGIRPTTLAIAPLSHGAGPHSFAVLTLGGTVVVLRQFDPAVVVSAIETYHVSDIWLPPTALYLLLEFPDIRRRDLTSLRHIWVSTMAIAPAKLREAVEVFGPCVTQVYGQIESGFVTALDAKTTAAAAAGIHPERLGSAGRTLFANRIAIMSEEGNMLSAGAAGEIVVRGTCIKRYFDDIQTTDARRFGWHHTGDVGYVDEEGFLYITGRIRDVINMAGFKIPCSQLEATILELVEVRDVAVVPLPDPLRGEVPHAIVVVKEGHVMTGDSIISHCRVRLGPQRVPKLVEIWPSLPISPAGKIDKRKVRQMLATRDAE
jgi:fatty-acyl-CoA synthase